MKVQITCPNNIEVGEALNIAKSIIRGTAPERTGAAFAILGEVKVDGEIRYASAYWKQNASAHIIDIQNHPDAEKMKGEDTDGD